MLQYTDPIRISNEFLEEYLTKEQKELYWKIYEEYLPIYSYLLLLNSVFRFDIFSRTNTITEELKEKIKFPLEVGTPMKNKKILINDFSEFYDYLQKYQKEGICKFKKLSQLLYLRLK